MLCILCYTQIILIGAVSNREQAQLVASKCKTLRVRGHQVWLWCRHLAQTLPGVQLDEGALDVYRHINSVPEQWVNNMVHAKTQSEADELLSSVQQTRTGPASDHLTTALEQERAAQVNTCFVNVTHLSTCWTHGWEHALT